MGSCPCCPQALLAYRDTLALAKVVVGQYNIKYNCPDGIREWLHACSEKCGVNLKRFT